MALINHVYLDAALTTQADTTSAPLVASAVQGAAGDGVFWFGSPNEAIKIQASSDPGVDPLIVAITDSDELSGVDAADIKIALTVAGLDTATGGASIEIGTTVLGGVSNAVPVYYRWTNGTGAGVYEDISLTITNRLQVAV